MIMYFEPQTGIYKDHDWESNFKHYRLDSMYSWSISMESYLDAAIEKATVGPSGLEYSPEFYEFLELEDRKIERLIKVAQKLTD